MFKTLLHFPILPHFFERGNMFFPQKNPPRYKTTQFLDESIQTGTHTVKNKQYNKEKCVRIQNFIAEFPAADIWGVRGKGGAGFQSNKQSQLKETINS